MAPPYKVNKEKLTKDLSDLGIQKGFKLFFQLDEIPKPDKMIEKAESWRPYRTLASWYLWRLIEGPFEW